MLTTTEIAPYTLISIMYSIVTSRHLRVEGNTTVSYYVNVHTMQ